MTAAASHRRVVTHVLTPASQGMPNLNVFSGEVSSVSRTLSTVRQHLVYFLHNQPVQDEHTRSSLVLQIELPPEFTASHELAVIHYLSNHLSGSQAWAQAFAAFDILDQAVLVTKDERTTFRQLYQQVVDRVLADTYIDELLELGDVGREGPALWARFARQIVQEVAQRGWRRPDVPATRLLLSYLLYWWGAFARGYALEVEVFRDLQQNGVQFTAHDLRDRQQRYSPSDLIVNGMAGDIKTSSYFVQVAAPLAHDFYIVRLSVGIRVYTLVVMLQPPAWEQINGDTVAGDLETMVQQFPAPVCIQYRGHNLVVLDYNEWKRRILRWQGAVE